jgi:hypothetical protein
LAVVRGLSLGLLALCSACLPPTRSEEANAPQLPPKAKPPAELAKVIRAEGSARSLLFDLTGELEDEATILPEHKQATYRDASTVARAVDAFLRIRFPIRFDDAHRVEIKEPSHSVAVLGKEGEQLLSVRFNGEAELRDCFPDKADADFMAGLFRRAVKEALAKSKRTGGEE